MSAAVSAAVIPGVARLRDDLQLPAPRIYDVSRDEEFTTLLNFLPDRVKPLVRDRMREVEEIRMSVHGPVEVLYRHAHVTYPVVLTKEELAILDSVGQWRSDGRLGMEGALHRLGRVMNQGHTCMVTVRVARAYVGLAEPLRPWLERAENGLVIVGVPGVGKTATLRDSLRILAERLAGRLFVNDSSNEIFGDGMRPHPIADWMSRVPIGDPSHQFEILNQVTKNFQPQWNVVDEVSRPEDARSIAYARSRGAKAVMTWHAANLEDAYRESEVRTLWPLIQRDERGLTGPCVASLGILVRGRGSYVVFEDMTRAFEDVAAGRLPEGVRVEVANPSRFKDRTNAG